MSKLDLHKPIPYSLSMWNGGREVFYKCAKCGTTFHILSDLERYCHYYGIKLNWTDSPRYCSEEFKKAYDDLRYNKHTYTGETKEVDAQLRSLLYDYYLGKFR